MPSEQIEHLLILQDRDKARMDLESQLASIPEEIETNRSRIAQEEEKAREARAELLKLENRHKALEGELEELNAKIVRYKNQQLEVKKNEEYQALEHEIEAVREKISAVEDEEIQILLNIDEGRKAVEEAGEACREKVSASENRIAKLEERAEVFRGQLDNAAVAAGEAREKVSPEYLDIYDRLLKHVRFPVVVALRDKKCRGCHLKVSSGVESNARAAKEIATCDSCGRILYYDG